MASVKLTGTMKDALRTDLMVHKFRDDIDALVGDYLKLADDVYRDIYPLADRQKMAVLPEGWLPTSKHLAVQFGSGSGYPHLSFSGRTNMRNPLGKYASPGDPVELVVQSRHKNNCAKRYENDEALAVRYHELEKRRQALEAKVVAAENVAKHALAHTATTVAALIERWPEIEPFAKRFLDHKPQAVAVNMTDVNRLFDLPPEEKAA